MKGFLTILRLNMLNHAAGIRKGSWRKNDGKLDGSRIVTAAAVIPSFAVLAVMLVWMQIMLFGALDAAGHPALLLGLALLVSIASTLLLGVFTVLSGLYFNKDMPRLSYLPVSSSAVFSVRWLEIWLSDVLINLLLLAPSVVLYGLKMQCDVLYYIRCLLIVLASPVIPLVLLTCLASVLARFTGLSRHKDAAVVVGSVLIALVVIGTEMVLLPKIPNDADAMFFVRLLLNQETMIQTLLGAFPPVLWALRGMLGDWMQTLLFLTVSLGCVVLCIVLFGPRYMTVCLSVSENAPTKRAARKGKSNVWRQQSPLRALFVREWKEILRTPVYAMNSLAGVVMIPVMMVFIAIGVSSSGENAALILPLIIGFLHKMSAADILLIFTAVLCFACLMNPAACTSVSREGNRLSMSRMIPVSPVTQLRAKMLMGMSINLLSGSGLLLFMAVCLREYTYLLIPAVIMSTLFSYATTAFGLTIDVIRPMLVWNNETQVMKQNLNVLLLMLVTVVFMALPAAAVFALLDAAPWIRLAAAGGILLVECIAGGVLLHTVGLKRYASLEG